MDMCVCVFPNLKPGTMRAYVTNGPRNAWTLVGRSVPVLEAREGGCRVVCTPCFKPRMPQTSTVPGFRLGPDLPRGGLNPCAPALSALACVQRLVLPAASVIVSPALRGHGLTLNPEAYRSCRCTSYHIG